MAAICRFPQRHLTLLPGNSGWGSWRVVYLCLAFLNIQFSCAHCTAQCYKAYAVNQILQEDPMHIHCTKHLPTNNNHKYLRHNGVKVYAWINQVVHRWQSTLLGSMTLIMHVPSFPVHSFLQGNPKQKHSHTTKLLVLGSAVWFDSARPHSDILNSIIHNSLLIRCPDGLKSSDKNQQTQGLQQNSGCLNVATVSDSANRFLSPCPIFSS